MQSSEGGLTISKTLTHDTQPAIALIRRRTHIVNRTHMPASGNPAEYHINTPYLDHCGSAASSLPVGCRPQRPPLAPLAHTTRSSRARRVATMASYRLRGPRVLGVSRSAHAVGMGAMRRWLRGPHSSSGGGGGGGASLARHAQAHAAWCMGQHPPGWSQNHAGVRQGQGYQRGSMSTPAGGSSRCAHGRGCADVWTLLACCLRAMLSSIYN